MIKKVSQFLVVVFLLVAIFFVLREVYSSIQTKRKIDKEVASLRAEANKFNQENKNLSKLVDYFNSKDFQEKEIKDKLNLVKEGERVVVVQGVATENQMTEQKNKDARILTKRANYYYWWQYFFGFKNGK
jgi:cell division protein FtsB